MVIVYVPCNMVGRDDDAELRELILGNDDTVIDIKSDKLKVACKRFVYLILGLAFVLVLWQVVAWYFNTYLIYILEFPTPETAFERLNEMFFGSYTISGKGIWTHIQASLIRWIEGFLTAFVIGLIIGIVISINDKLYSFGSVPVNVLQLIPGLAWFPVTLLLFGFGDKAAIFIIAITAISPIAISIANGLRRVPKIYIELAQMSGKTRLETFFQVLLPYSAMDIVVGLRIGMANGWRMLISAEMVVGVVIGLGYSIDAAVGIVNYPTAFASIVIICVIGLIIDKVVLSSIETYVRNKTGLEAMQ